ncbi:hypothetical protein BGW36DRAFT_428716 [Talaromyces proteolyticus]|uniref:phospholipase D n=1 Tax=Talaromyces proteolyticus TaxID=1131652 RepID=A0AAD4PXS5_9EURO|nr:uncharacterized protein BGW36DRAFT_428716 [Talaromyces proteolyticus]KAH8696724.1 hypothetical protein BGW36DRAFT_428716 [Talaromyces proteolyticus]
MSGNENPLAYGRYYGERAEGDSSERGLGDSARGFLSDGVKKFKDHYGSSQQQQQGAGYAGHGQGQAQPFQGNYGPPPQQPQPQPQQPPPPQHSQYSQDAKQDRLSGFLGKFQNTVSDVGAQLAQKIGTTLDADGYSQYGPKPTDHRFKSFAPPRENNDVKWHVDGFTYFWAVSQALESAKESIWILDWWLSPELYLRRPPAKNERYRLDRMLQAAAQRGVRVNIIVYKEVEKALTLCSEHTKRELEALHPNILVFRHPDHLPDANEIKSDLTASFQHLSLDSPSLSKLPSDTIKAFYGTKGDTVLFWAHHEKLLLVDGKIAFMGGLDLCFGRWDTNQHAIADVHPGDLQEIVFPGQDYNNARVLDFQDVAHWEQNQLNRKVTSRIGWSDISISLRGPVVEDLRRHFVDRWNYIYDTKYYARNETKYQKLSLYRQYGGQSQGGASAGPTTPVPAGQQQPPPPPNQGQLSQEPHWQQPQQQQSQLQPQWQGGQPSYPPTPGSHGQQQPQWQSQQQPTGQLSYPPPPSSQEQQQQQTQWQSQQPSATQSYPPPASSQGNEGQQQQLSYSQQQPHWQGQQQAPSQSEYNSSTSAQLGGQYFPPPPPGPPPSHTGGDHSSQTQINQDPSHSGFGSGQYSSQTSNPSQAPYFAPPPIQESQHSQTRGLSEGGDLSRGYTDNQSSYNSEYQGNGRSTTQNIMSDVRGLGHSLRGQLAGQVHQYQDRYITNLGRTYGNQWCQVVRSCSKWSAGIPTEHSIQDAYIAAIRNSQHFVYIENQFFITATGDEQKPVQNKIGAAIVERVLRAARAGQKYKIIVVIPAVPGFAGDLRDDSSLGTRAIMEFQYNSINRGGHSIMELIAKEGYNPMDYIRFYNLRNYDRINTNSTMVQAEKASGINYEDARKYHDAAEVGYGGYGPGAPGGFDTTRPYDQYQKAASAHPSATSGRWDSVSECYMLGGEDIRKVPWDSDLPEIDAFVSEELYIHSKVLIADDRIVICGSANLNDRSQLGTHDSEIALVIEDPTPLESQMDGQPYRASKFAASLRRELFRKHLGLLKPQDYHRANANCEPVGVPNETDLSSPESQIVADPLSNTFQSLWNSRARTNTEVFRKVFNPVPDDYVRNWNAYKEFYEYNFRKADVEAEGKPVVRPGRYEWGHVVRDNFAPGPEGAQQVKELLSQVKGTLVEMPLMFLIEEDIAKEGLTLNAFTEEIYT